VRALGRVVGFAAFGVSAFGASVFAVSVFAGSAFGAGVLGALDVDRLTAPADFAGFTASVVGAAAFGAAFVDVTLRVDAPRRGALLATVVLMR
jgi:hypothetical protein